MNIKTIKLNGFRNIDNIHLDFSNKLIALIALNNFGKSNVIKALRFAKMFIEIEPKIKTQMMSLFKVIPINNKTAHRNFRFFISFMQIFEQKEYIINYAFEFEWRKNELDKGQRIVNEHLEYKENSKGTKFKTLIKRNEDKTTYLSSPEGRCSSKLKVSDNMLAINKLANYDDLFYLAIVEQINNLNIGAVDLQNYERLFKGLHFSNKTKDFSSNLPESHDISRFIYELKQNDNDKYELFVDAIQSLLPNIEYFLPIKIDFKNNISDIENSKNVPFHIPENLYDIRVKESANNQATGIEFISAGSRKLFFILATAIAADKNKLALLALEELENSIHPHLFQKLLIILDSVTENTKMLITSHSPYVLQYLDLENIYIGIPNKEQTATFKKIKASKQRKLMNEIADADSSLGDYLFDMMLESYEDNSVFNNFI